MDDECDLYKSQPTKLQFLVFVDKKMNKNNHSPPARHHHRRKRTNDTLNNNEKPDKKKMKIEGKNNEKPDKKKKKKREMKKIKAHVEELDSIFDCVKDVDVESSSENESEHGDESNDVGVRVDGDKKKEESESEESSSEESELSSESESSSSKSSSSSSEQVETVKSKSVKSKSVKENENDKLGKEEKIKLSEIDQQIAALEAELNELSSADDDDDDDDDEEEAKEEEHESEKPAIIKDEEGLERIPALPSHLLPAQGISTKKTEKPAKQQTEKEKEEENKVYVCETCQGYRCYGKKEWDKHKRTMLHRQNTVLEAGAAYEPARNKALYCRVCKLDFENADELYTHRETETHKDNQAKERRASYCQVCRKQFTSAHQLKEHVKGRLHNETLEMKRGEWRQNMKRY